MLGLRKKRMSWLETKEGWVRQDPPLPLLAYLPPLSGELAHQEAADDRQDAHVKHSENHAATRAGKEAPYPVGNMVGTRHCRSRRPGAARKLRLR